MSDIERHRSSSVALAGDDERALQRIMARARIIAKMGGLPAELADNPEAVAARMINLEGYGLPITVPGIVNSFDLIQDKLVPTAQMYQALAVQNGYQLVPVERTQERAVARISKPGHEPVTVTYTLDDARASGRLDEWVEKWSKSQSGRSYLDARTVIRVDGENRNEPWPEWVTDAIAKGKVKRFDAWFNYRADMLWKAAAKRAIKIACPHVLLGGGDPDDIEISGLGSPSLRSTFEDPPPHADPSPDTNIVDAEVVDEPVSAAGDQSGFPSSDVSPPAAEPTSSHPEQPSLEYGPDEDPGRPF